MAGGLAMKRKAAFRKNSRRRLYPDGIGAAKPRKKGHTRTSKAHMGVFRGMRGKA
jgi:hypothetical protein